MLNLFRTNQFLNSAFLLFYILLFWASAFILPVRWEPTTQSIFSEVIYNWIGTQSVASKSLAIFLLLVQAFMINLLVLNHRLGKEANLFPGLFYILVSCAIPDFLHLSPILLGTTFYIIAVYELFNTHKKTSCAIQLFNVGFWLAIASMFYFSFAFFLLLGIAGLSILRTFRIKDFLQMLMGFGVLYFLAATYFFWYNKLPIFWQNQVVQNFHLPSGFPGLFNWESYLKIGLFGFLFLFLLLNTGYYKKKKLIREQKKISLLFWGLLIAGLAIAYLENSNFEQFQLIAFPAGVFLAFSFADMKRNGAEAVHLLILLALLAFQYKSFFF